MAAIWFRLNWKLKLAAGLPFLSPIRARLRRASGSRRRFLKSHPSSGPATDGLAKRMRARRRLPRSWPNCRLPTVEIYAMPAATSSLLDDSGQVTEQWIAEEVEAAFAEQEGAAFVSGEWCQQAAWFPEL
ncbi:phage major capsid protein [Brucella abortus]|nr:phage major capsid protein [Brucella abortus]